MSIQAQSRENISLWDLKRSVAFLAPSNSSSSLQYIVTFLFIQRTNSQRSNAGQPNSRHSKWGGGETGEKELKMAKGIRGSKQDKGIGDSWCDLV